jgi:small-conductance mechanosensitive channel
MEGRIMDTVIPDLEALWVAVAGHDPRILLLQLLVLAAGAVAAFFIHRRSQATLTRRLEAGKLPVLRRLILKTGQRLAFPLISLLAVLVGKLVFHWFGLGTPLLDVMVELLVALACIRLIVFALRTGIAQGTALRAWEKVISTGIWVIVALHILGWLPVVEAFMDQLAFHFGASRISLLMVLKLAVLSALYILVALWLTGFLENQLRRAPSVNVSLRVGLSKVVKVLLLFVALMLALTEAGVDLSSLTFFGGALGVGLGFGLQKIVSNFISGFILLGDRSIRPGDVISIGDNYGWVKQLRARYIVVRNRDGVETLIPNENLVTSEVINWSFSDRRVRVRIPVQISYQDDPEQAMAIMQEAAFANERVLRIPVPAVRLMAFADSGIALELRIWLGDPEAGVGNVRSDINLAIWRGFKAAGITIPYPQRDVHLRQVDSPPAVTN